MRQYNAGGGPPGTYVGTVDPKIRPLLLTDDEISELVEFLNTLTGISPAAHAATAQAADPTAWDWTKNTAKPPLPSPGTGGSGGSGGSSGSGGSTGTGGTTGSGGATGSGGSTGTTGIGGAAGSGSTGTGGTT